MGNYVMEIYTWMVWEPGKGMDQFCLEMLTGLQIKIIIKLIIEKRVEFTKQKIGKEYCKQEDEHVQSFGGF